MSPQETIIQTVEPDYAFEEVRRKYTLWRYDSAGGRYYFRISARKSDQTAEVHWFPSVTTALHRVMPSSPALVEWIARYGIEEAERRKMESACYGTCLHILIADYMKHGIVEVSAPRLALLINGQAAKDRVDVPNLYDWQRRLRKDLLSFHALARERDIRPLAIEMPLSSAVFGVAGTIDLVCTMRYRGNGPIVAIIDFKSGRKGVWPEYRLQTNLYRAIWNEHYPAHAVAETFIFQPSDWKGTSPTYKLTQTTDDEQLAHAKKLLDLHHTTQRVRPGGALMLPTVAIERERAAETYVRIYHPDEIAFEAAKGILGDGYRLRTRLMPEEAPEVED